ncbi:MAG: flagellar hook-length control protein FliK [Hyphomicrobiales bacterium]
MSTLPDLLAPIAPPATAERPAPRARSDAQDDAPRFSDRLDNERADAKRSSTREPAETKERPDTSEASAATDTGETETAVADERAASSDSPRDDDQASVPVDSDESTNTDNTDDAVAALVDPSLIANTDGVRDEITVTALSGETMPLVPPQATGQADPGALGRWFAQASGPVEGPIAQSAGLLNKLAGQTSQQALAGAHDANVDGVLMGANPNPTGQTTQMQGAQTSFADAMTEAAMTDAAMTSNTMASSSMDAESLDALVTQAMAKTSASLEPGGTNAPTITTGQTVATGAQAAMTAVPQAATGQAVPVTALAVEINRQAMNGKTQFDIRLDPPELGRLNVRLEMDASGQTRTHMIVERAETLDMLATDARSLERALQQAGLKTEPGSVTFELAQDAADGFAQDQQSANADDQSAESGAGDSSTLGADEQLSAEDIASPEAIRQQLYVTGHLDVRI